METFVFSGYITGMKPAASQLQAQTLVYFEPCQECATEMGVLRDA